MALEIEMAFYVQHTLYNCFVTSMDAFPTFSRAREEKQCFFHLKYFSRILVVEGEPKVHMRTPN